MTVWDALPYVSLVVALWSLWYSRRAYKRARASLVAAEQAHQETLDAIQRWRGHSWEPKVTGADAATTARIAKDILEKP
jgi:hypothetical protein